MQQGKYHKFEPVKRFDEYSKKLVIEVGKKYNRRTLFRMKQFYNVFSNEKGCIRYSLNCWNKTSNESEKRFNKL